MAITSSFFPSEMLFCYSLVPAASEGHFREPSGE